MPQLDTIYIFLIFNWTWVLLLLISQKIKTFRISKWPLNPNFSAHFKPSPTLPWT